MQRHKKYFAWFICAYFIVLGGVHLYFVSKRLEFSVIVLGNRPATAGHQLLLRLVAFDEDTGRRLAILSTSWKNLEKITKKTAATVLKNGITHLHAPLSGSVHAQHSRLTVDVRTAKGLITLKIPIQLDAALPHPEFTFSGKAKTDAFIIPRRERDFPFHLAISPANGLFAGNQKNTVYLRLVDRVGQPISRKLLITIREKKQSYQIQTNSLGLASLKMTAIAPRYTLKIAVADREGKKWLFLRYLASRHSNLRATDISPLAALPAVIRSPLSRTSQKSMRYCEHYARGRWLGSAIVPANANSCDVRLSNTGLHTVAFNTHYALNIGVSHVRVLAYRGDPGAALSKLALEMVKKDIDAGYCSWLHQHLRQKPRTSGDLATLAGYLMSLHPLAASSPARLLDSRKDRLLKLNSERSGARKVTLYLLTLSCVVMLLGLLFVMLRTYFETRRRIRLEWDEEIEIDVTNRITSFAPMWLLAVAAATCIAVLMLLWNLS